MQAHIVLAHPEPKSFNAHLAGVARASLERSGWSVTMSDLYAMGFDPCERLEHYPKRENHERYNVQGQQRHASDTGSIPADVQDQIARLDAADLLILQYPMWWHLPPAIIKGWYDRVLIYGEVYTSKKRFEAGRFAGKRAMLSVTVGTSPETYEHNGRSGDIDLMLWPVHFTLAYVGYTVLAPFVAYGVEAGIRYSDPSRLQTRLAGISESLGNRLCHLDEVPAVPFNRMSEWDEDGRVKRSAPAHSPFIRHRRELELS